MTSNNPDDLSALPEHLDPPEYREAYRLARQKLISANRSRSALRVHDDYRRELILELKAKLELLEASLREEAASRSRIHRLNEEIAKIVKAMENSNDEIADIVSEKGDTGIRGWIVRLARLVPLIQNLRELRTKAIAFIGQELSAGHQASPIEDTDHQKSILKDERNETASDTVKDVHRQDTPILGEYAESVAGSGGGDGSVVDTNAAPFGSPDWRTWDAMHWNSRLLEYCFFRDGEEPAWAGIPATEEELKNIIDDDTADANEVARYLIHTLQVSAARRRHSDGRAFTAGDLFQLQARSYKNSADRTPPYFAFLWTTCLIAQGYPDPQEDGEFHARYERVFGRRENQQLRMLPKAWEELSLWLAIDSLSFGECGDHRRLELPPVDSGRRLISHSWKLSFPRRSDRKRLQDGLDRYSGEGILDPCSLELIDFLHYYGGFAQTFATELEEHLRRLRAGESPEDWFTGIIRREIIAWTAQSFDRGQVKREAFGSLLLRRIPGEGFGLLVLEDATLQDPYLTVSDGDEFGAPGWRVLIDSLAADPSWAAFDVGARILDKEDLNFPDASRAIAEGILIFAPDPRDGLPRLLLDSHAGEASHVLVDERKSEDFLACFGGSDEGCIEDGWTCIRGFEADASDLAAFRRGEALQVNRGPALVPIDGIPLLNGWLPSQLGLPSIRVRGSAAPESLVLIDQVGNELVYDRSRTKGEEELWKVPRDRAAIDRLTDGQASFKAIMPGADQLLRRRMTIRSFSGRPKFLRKHHLFIREDWGRLLGPLICESESPQTPRRDTLNRARSLFSQDPRANPGLESEILDALCARFANRSWISRHEFYGLYRRLDPNTRLRAEWPLLMDGFLRAWCEGGWLDEGLEERRFLWRIQPVDPRLVRRPDGKARLVGLTSSADLLQILAWAMDVCGVSPQAIRPANPRLPRGWEFSGDLATLALKTGLRLVEPSDWVADVTTAPWKVEPLGCDGPEWPPTPHAPKTQRQLICGLRNGAHIARDVAPTQRPNNSTAIICEEEGFGRRRWRTEGKQKFISTVRNRVCLAAAAEASNGCWPFGFVDQTRIERLFDCDAYLPLPIGRASALLGAEMPGPTLVQPSSHTHRYTLDLQSAASLRHDGMLPLPPWGA